MEKWKKSEFQNTCVKIEHVTKRFGEDLVLKEVNLTLKVGQVYGVVGNNGSGKTVLMKCICGFLPVTTGTIRVFGKEIGRDVDFPESLGVIIETPGFLTQYTGVKNLEILADMKRMISKADIRLILKKVGLDPDMKKPVGKYSLGMRQRLGIAQAIMENPMIIILDEPMNGLDEDGVVEMRRIFNNLKEEFARFDLFSAISSSFISSHVMPICSNISNAFLARRPFESAIVIYLINTYLQAAVLQ